MATITPEIKPQETKKTPVILTSKAIAKVKEIMSQQDPTPAGLRVGVVGGAAPASPIRCLSKMSPE